MVRRAIPFLCIGLILFSLVVLQNGASWAFRGGNYFFSVRAYNLWLAEPLYTLALRLDPAFPGPHYQLARIYFVQSNFSAAEREINTELALHPEFKRSYYVRGLIYGYSGQLEKAEADFKTFLEWKPDSWAGNNDLAWIYFQQGKYPEARNAARAGLKVAPGNAWLLNSLGVALLNLGDRKGAGAAFSQALGTLARMSEKDWGRAYPGNDPRVYGEGFSQMKASLEENLELARGDTPEQR